MRSLDLLSTWPVGAVSAGVVTADSAMTSVVGTWGDIDRPYYWASVTKLCTALTVLVAVEETTLSLEEAAGPPGSTVAHLLAHASGLAPSGGAVLEPPGQRRIYSNAGFDLLGELLAERSGIVFADYLREAVLEPLGMRGARLPPGGSPAAGMYGSVRDLVLLAAELLAPTLIAPVTLERATAVAFPGLSGVLPGFGRQDPCDWGLGFELRDAKRPHWTGTANSPRTFGHFGQAGGFVWVDPEAQVACVSLSDRAFGPWAAEAWPKLSDAVLADCRPAVRTDNPTEFTTSGQPSP
jgi:CubicO group peptidase (beta-lactamase class C family)